MAHLRVHRVRIDFVPHRTAMTARAIFHDEALVFHRPVARAKPR